MKDDTISRQAAIEALTHFTNLSWNKLKTIYSMLTVIEELPSAERRGRWKKCKKNLFFPDDDIFTCSECFHNYFKRTNYCPNCGAKMDEVDE